MTVQQLIDALKEFQPEQHVRLQIIQISDKSVFADLQKLETYFEDSVHLVGREN